MPKYILLFFVAIFGISCGQQDYSHDPIIRVTVLDQDFNGVTVIVDRNKLNKIESILNRLKKIDGAEFGVNSFSDLYKFDVASEKRINPLNARWIYRKDGYIVKLSKQLRPQYFIENAEEFNEILGFNK